MIRRVYSTGPEGRIDPAPTGCTNCNAQPCRCPTSASGSTILVERLRRGKQGKTVTSAGPLPLSRDAATALLAELKRRCGSGGTLRSESSADGSKQLHMEIQGDHVDRLQQEFAERGFAVKRKGG
jgi:translation initiation factor 1